MLWRGLKALQIYGANTNVGKTIVSTLLCKALQSKAPNGGLLYLKPVSTGPAEDADDRHIKRYVPGVRSKCISQFSKPVSPHIAAREAKNDVEQAISNSSIIGQVKKLLGEHLLSGGRYALLETAGGVLSPAPSGTVQADLYRPLRLPVVLVADGKLGGIATTLSAFESLHMRGYNVESVIVLDDPQWGNYDYLIQHFKNLDVPTFGLPLPPTRHHSIEKDEQAMTSYYETTSVIPALVDMIDRIDQSHFSRVSKLTSMPSHAESILWHPFRQHGLPQNVIAIDSAYGDHFQAYDPEADNTLTSRSPKDPSSLAPLVSSVDEKLVLGPLFDGSASWWTQGLGHGNPELALTAAHAAGRYGHVMFANAVHEPALDISHNLLSTLANPRLSRVFFTDNGSTGMEVAVKMALRASCARYGWKKEERQLGILGLKGSYHGDTIGVMNCSEPGIYNEKVDWYQPWGHWFDPPQLKMQKEKWELEIPDSISPAFPKQNRDFTTLDDVFDFDGRTQAGHTAAYEEFIKDEIQDLVAVQGKRFGALIMEPIVMGAGGMILVDPLFQRTLIKVVRETPGLFSPSTKLIPNPTAWSGLPIIADEVFTGLYRLGRASSSSFLSSPASSYKLDVDIAPDISVHAKLLTGGLLPLAITTASQAIFEAFLGDKKQDALLHGHSYTAHAVGCTVADKSLKQLNQMNAGEQWGVYKGAWSRLASESASGPATSKQKNQIAWSFFSPSFIQSLSRSNTVSGVFALGSVLAISLKDRESGYNSNAAASLQSFLLKNLDEEGGGIHSRVLGNVLYLMTSLTTEKEGVDKIEKMLVRALC